MHSICRVAVAALAVACVGPVAFAQAVGSELQVNSYTTGQEDRPAVAGTTDGTYLVVWARGDGFGDIRGQLYASDGAALGSEFVVNEPSPYGLISPAVAADGTSGFIVVWQSDQVIPPAIFGRRVGADGGLGAQFRVDVDTAGSSFYPRVAALSDGSFAVVWSDLARGAADQGAVIVGRRVDASASPLGDEFFVSEFTSARDEVPVVAAVSDGFVVAWRRLPPIGTPPLPPPPQPKVIGRRLDLLGQPLSGDYEVNDDTASYNWNPSVATGGSGEFVVVWASNRDGNYGGIFGQRFSSSGSPVGTNFEINSYTPGSQMNPAIASDGAAGFLVTWMSGPGQDGSSFGVFAKRLDESATPLGGDFQVNTHTTGIQRYPAVASGEDGRFLVVWTDESGEDGDQHGVFGQRISLAADTTPPTVTVTTPNGGETLSSGTPFLIQWTASDDVAVDHIDVEYSTDGGTNYSAVPGCTSLAGSATSCSWTNPGPAANTALVRVTATDTSANSASDSSDATFAIWPALSVDDVTVSEAAGTMTFTVSLSSPSPNTITVKYKTANGTAMSGSDYTAKPLTTLTFSPGQTSKSVTVTIMNDTKDEDDEFFFLNLSAATNAAIGDSQGLGTIQDDDPLPSLSISDASVTEGDSGTKMMTFTLTLSPASGRSVSVTAATANAGVGPGFASAPSDYMAKTQTLTFTGGQTSKTFTVTIKGDTLDEGDEIFNVNLSSAPNATIVDGQGVGTIINNDSLVGAPSLSISDATVTEGDAGTTDATFTVSLSGPATQPVAVHYATMNVTAMSGATGDYLSKSGTLTFPVGGSLSQNVVVKVNGDVKNEADETFFVNLSSPVQATIADGQGLGTIQDNDPLPTLSIGDASLTEGNSGTQNMTFTLTLSAASGRSVSVHYATAAAGSGAGFATVPADYAAKSGTVTFSAGQTSKTITVSIKGDLLVEGDETFNVNLDTPVNATVSDGQAVGTIIDND